ncbi:MAG: nucleotide disphospho-sugar-binding domain-containing protein, partial [Verrucomicrobiales bacterium]
MANIVYITNGLSSTLHSSLELSRRLRGVGHQVTYVSFADLGEVIEGEGYPFHRLRAGEIFQKKKKDRRPPKRERRTIRGWFRWRAIRKQVRKESIENREIEELIAALRPDLLLIDIEFHVAILAAIPLGIPILLPVVWYSLYHHPLAPPLNTSLIPNESAESRRGIARAWRRVRREARLPEWRHRFSRFGDYRRHEPLAYDTFWIDDLREFARSRGLRIGQVADRSQFLRPFLYRDLPILSFNIREMEFPGIGHPNFHYVGPMVLRGRSGAGDPAGERHRWERFRDAVKGSGRPLLYASLGTYWSGGRAFLATILDAFRHHPEWSLVLGLGGTLDPAELEPIPPNALVLSWAPQVEILQVADAAIIHGGVTTLNECLSFGVPMLVYSTHHVDQDGCAARVEYHGVGLMAEKDEDDCHALSEKIGRLLSKQDYEQRLAEMKAAVEKSESERLAINLIEGY